MPQTLALEPLEQIDDRGLVAACDVLVLRALELVGKRIVRAERSRFGRMGDKPFHEAHVEWQPDAEMLDKSLASAWTFLPQVVSTHAMPHVSPKQVELVLDRYVRDLVQQSRGHDVQDLRYCLRAFT
jgi:hypothetical protein